MDEIWQKCLKHWFVIFYLSTNFIFHLLDPSYLSIDTVDNQTVTTDALQMLYVHQLSENEAVLMTIDQFGVTELADGIYTCIATNNLTEARSSVDINVLGDSDTCL